MGYWVEDRDEKWLGDIATNSGIRQLAEMGLPALREFVDAGTADEALLKRVIAETAGRPELADIAEMLKGAAAPVFITDGAS